MENRTELAFPFFFIGVLTECFSEKSERLFYLFIHFQGYYLETGGNQSQLKSFKGDGGSVGREIDDSFFT